MFLKLALSAALNPKCLQIFNEEYVWTSSKHLIPYLAYIIYHGVKTEAADIRYMPIQKMQEHVTSAYNT